MSPGLNIMKYGTTFIFSQEVNNANQFYVGYSSAAMLEWHQG